MPGIFYSNDSITAMLFSPYNIGLAGLTLAGVRRGTSLVPVPVVRQARGSNRQARGNRQRQPTGARQQHRRTRGGTSLTVRGNRRAHGNTTGHWPARHYQSVIRRERTDVRDCWFSVL